MNETNPFPPPPPQIEVTRSYMFIWPEQRIRAVIAAVEDASYDEVSDVLLNEAEADLKRAIAEPITGVRFVPRGTGG